MEDTQKILTRPISEIPVGEEIQSLCQKHKVKNLDELLKVSDYDMVHKLGFNYHAVINLFGYLQSVGLEDLMENPGNKLN